MADAWTNLVTGSTIETGDAWEHLLAQGGGDTIVNQTILGEWSVTEKIMAINIEQVQEEIELVVNAPETVVDITEEYVIEVKDE